MSRSRRKTSISAITKNKHASEKQFKRHTHKVARASERSLLKKVVEVEDLEVKLPRKSREAVETYCGDKDGKSWFGDLKKKNPRYYEKLMRK